MTVLEAESAEIATEILDCQSVRLLLVDPDLPFVDGIDFLDRLDDPPRAIVVSSSPVPKKERARLSLRLNLGPTFQRPL